MHAHSQLDASHVNFGIIVDCKDPSVISMVLGPFLKEVRLNILNEHRPDN